MAKYLYLDTLRMVCPGESLDRKFFDFYVFGSFDALKVEAFSSVPEKQEERDKGEEAINTLQELHRINKQRRQDVPARFDKQPMHLYTPDDSADRIFGMEGEYAARPLVLTLMQLDDYSIRTDEPDELVKMVRVHLDRIRSEVGPAALVEYEVFFCLGEPDIVIAFRGAGLLDIGRMIFRMRDEILLDGNHILRVLSTSSHCAFPRAQSPEELKENVDRWIGEEKDTEFLTLFDSAFDLDHTSAKGKETGENAEEKFQQWKMLLGEWDHIHKWDQSEFISHFAEFILEPVTCDAKGGYSSFRASYSVPVIKLQESDRNYALEKKRQPQIPFHDDQGFLYDRLMEEYTEEENAFDELSDKIKGLEDMYGPGEGTKTLREAAESMKSTLIGILKHLRQLKDGSFQYDLCAFVLPAFCALPRIARNVSFQVGRILKNFGDSAGRSGPGSKEYTKARDEAVSTLLDSYIHDTSRLLAELQHLFSVLSISPHTYMESYGSSMRSITASSKLLVAYQGIACSLSSHFDMKLRKEGIPGRQANEVMLVIPYRRIHQNTRVLFEYTSPEDRIVYIRINASDMFKVQKTLFMLLHECGHHIINYGFRSERNNYYFEAYAAYLLDQVFGVFYREPVRGIQSVFISKKGLRASGLSGQSIHLKYTEEAVLKDAFIELLRDKSKDMSGQFRDHWEKDYRKDERIMKLAEPVALENDLFLYLKDAVCSYTETKLQELQEYYDDEGFCAVNSLASNIHDLFKNFLIPFFLNPLDEEYKNRKYEDDNELWKLAELRTVYRSFPEERITDLVRAACMNTIRASYKDIAAELKNIFSDIYSDIFAFSMLRIRELPDKDKNEEARKYIALLRYEAGFRLKTEFSHFYQLVRILAVLQGYFDLRAEDADQMIAEVLSLPEEDTAELKKNLDFARNRAGFRAVRDYTDKLCIPRIERELSPTGPKSSGLLIRDSEMLKEMYDNAENGDHLKSFIDALYYFWKASTQRKQDESV